MPSLTCIGRTARELLRGDPVWALAIHNRAARDPHGVDHCHAAAVSMGRSILLESDTGVHTGDPAQ
jgi:hypothetical protein